MPWVAALVAVLTALCSLSFATRCDAQSAPAFHLDPDSLCSAPTGVPAFARSTGRVVYLVCRSNGTGATEVRFVIVNPGGRVQQQIVLARCGDGCLDWPPTERIRRRIARAERDFVAGGFVPMQRAEGIAPQGVGPAPVRAHGAGRVIAFDPTSGALRLLDASGSVLATMFVAGAPATGYCCGAEETSPPCVLQPQLVNAWIDADGRLVVAEIVTGSGIDACERGPDFLVLSAP